MEKYQQVSKFAESFELKCQVCFGTGLTYIADGQDDYVIDYCDCSNGDLLQKSDEMKI